MRNAWVVAMGVAAVALHATAGDPAEVLVAGPLAPDEGLTLAGRVVGGTGPVSVLLQRRECESGVWLERTEGVSVRVAADGRFRFEGLVPGRYDCDFEDQRLHFERNERTVYLVRDVLDHDLVVPSNCRVRGRVKQPASPPVADMRVDLGVFLVLVAADGTFETPDVLPGEYRLRVRGWRPVADDPIGSTCIERSYALRLGGGVTERDVDLTPDEDVRIAITVSGARPGPDAFEGSCSATSADVATEPFWFRAKRDGASWSAQRTSAGIFGDEWGTRASTFRVDGLPRGRHVLRLDAPGFEPWTREIDVGGPTRVEARLVPRPGRYLRVEGLPAFERTEFRRPGGAWSEVLVSDHRRIVMDGPYEPPDGLFLAAGAWEWRFESQHAAPMAPVALDVAGDGATLTWRPPEVMSPFLLLNGRLTTPTGKPLGGVAIHVAVREGDSWRALPTKTAVTSRTEGRFQLVGLRAGRWRVALDETGSVVLGEFDVADANLTRDFRFVPR